MRILSIFDCRPASCRARNSTVATFSASEGLELERPEGYPAGGAVGRGADEIDGDGECYRKEIDGAGEQVVNPAVDLLHGDHDDEADDG